MSTVLAGRYRLGSVIGRGGMGDVRAATDEALDRTVAVKLMRADLADDPELRRRFEREARAAARVSHPNVVAIYDVGEDDGVPFIVMEQLSGRTLAHELADGPLTEDRVRAVATEMLDALAAAHDLGVIHRDIKPGNVLVRDDGRVAIGDFGIATIAADTTHTATGTLFGTAQYLAPERLLGEPATPVSDLYSVGVVLFEALTGRPAFRADTPLGLAHAVANDTPTFTDTERSQLGSTLSDVVERAMAKDPDARFRSTADMRDALTGSVPPHAAPTVPMRTTPPAPAPTERIASPEAATPVTEHFPRPVGTEPPAARRRRVGPIAVAGLLVAGATGVVLVSMIEFDGSSAPSTVTTTVTSPTSAAVPAPLRTAIDQLDREVDR